MTDITNPQQDLERPPAAVRFVGDLAKITMTEGDLFVITCTEILSIDAVEQIKRDFRAIAPGMPLLVLGKHMSFEVMTRGAAMAALDTAAANAG